MNRRVVATKAYSTPGKQNALRKSRGKKGNPENRAADRHSIGRQARVRAARRVANAHV